MLKLAILNDYQHAALKMADWPVLQDRCRIEVFDRNLEVPDEAARELADFHILCPVRARMPMPRALIGKLPNLQFIAITGVINRTLDLQALADRGIPASVTGRRGQGAHATPELVWGLILASARHIPLEDRNMRRGVWQSTIGTTLTGRVLGLLGLGRIGHRMAEIGAAFGMEVIAWSQNLTKETATSAGVKWVDKETLLKSSDFLSVHLVLGKRSRGLIGAPELALMKPSAFLINSARGPIIEEAALIDALQAGRIQGAGLDVYDIEPMAPDHPFLKMDNVVLTPHLGFVADDSYRVYYEDSVENILAFLDGNSIRLAY
ncbi:MAG: D-2-hydroxyacid dehydrogenase family protein [Rhodospirillales bacterium]|nr:D-2-hydroxyacid dehydrogenase family protein [Rhodospirillales bacterium]